MNTKKSHPLKGWKVLFRYATRFKGELLFLSFIAVIVAIIGGFIPFITGRFLDGLINLSNTVSFDFGTYPQWLFFLTLFAILSLISDIFGWISEKRRRYLGTRVSADYPATTFGRILLLPLGFHDEERLGRISERVQRARGGVINIMEILFIDLAPQFLSIVVGIIIMILLNVALTAILVSGIILYTLTLFRIVPPIVEMQRKGNKKWAEAWGIAMDALSNVRQVKQATSEKYEAKRMHRKWVLGAAKYWFNLERIWSGINFYQRIIVTFTRASIFFVSVFFISRGELSVGELVAFNGYASMVFIPFARLGHNWQRIQSGLVGLEQVDEMLSTPEENFGRKKIKQNKIEGRVEFKDVSFKYKPRSPIVLDKISFSVNPGEIVALVGESGVGKSTIIDLLSGYYFSTKGKILIDGVDTKEADLYSLRDHISVVPQEPVLFNDTIYNNIKYGSFKAKKEDIEQASEKAYASEFIENFPKKYKQLVGERGVKLSVGQKQRVAIARAILRDPSILILDEPTSALDPKTEQLITRSLDDLMKGRTTFIIAHRLSTVRRADRIIVLKDGKIVEEGKHSDLIEIEGGVYKKMHDYHIGLHE